MVAAIPYMNLEILATATPRMETLPSLYAVIGKPLNLRDMLLGIGDDQMKEAMMMSSQAKILRTLRSAGVLR